MTNKFSKPLLQRDPGVLEGFSLFEQNRARSMTKELMFGSRQTAVAVFVYDNGFARMGAAPEVHKVLSELRGAWINLSDEELNVAYAGTALFKHFLGIAERINLHDWMIYVNQINREQVRNVMEGRGLTLFAAPMCLLLPGNKEWMEGLASDPEFQDAFAQVYGEEAKEWLRAVVKAADNQEQVAAVHQALSGQDNGLENALGEHFSLLDIREGTALLSVTPILATTHPDDVDRRRNALGL